VNVLQNDGLKHIKGAGGDPLRARHMGGRVPPSSANKGGGGWPPVEKLMGGG